MKKNGQQQHAKYRGGYYNNKARFINIGKQNSKTVNTQNLIILDPNLYVEWFEALENHFLSESPEYGGFMTTKEVASVAKITDEETWPEVMAILGMEASKTLIDKLKLEEATRFYKEKLKRDKFYKSAFHTMLKTITDAQLETIRVDAEWQTAKENQDPIKLVNILEKRLIYGIAGLPDTEAKDVISSKYNDPQQFNQKPNEDVHKYIRRSKQLFKTLVARTFFSVLYQCY